MALSELTPEYLRRLALLLPIERRYPIDDAELVLTVVIRDGSVVGDGRFSPAEPRWHRDSVPQFYQAMFSFRRSLERLFGEEVHLDVLGSDRRF